MNPARASRRPLLILAPVLLAGCPMFSEYNVISDEEELQIGQKVAAEVEKENAPLRDRFLQDYVNDVGWRVARAALEDRPGIPYTFKVIAAKEVNAFACPGGPVYIQTGLLAAAGDESEVVGVLGHEIGHVVAKHGARQMSKEIGIESVLDAILGEKGNDGARAGAKILGGVFLLHYSREDELEADSYGLKYAVAAGYDPDGLARMFERLRAEAGDDPGSVERLLSTHPALGERVARIRGMLVASPPPRGLLRDRPYFQQVKRRLPR